MMIVWHLISLSARLSQYENLMVNCSAWQQKLSLCFYYEDLSLFDFNCVEWHWHMELEFVYMESGTMTFWIGEKQFILSQGDGLFINSKILHRFYSSDGAVIPKFFVYAFFYCCAGQSYL